MDYWLPVYYPVLTRTAKSTVFVSHIRRSPSPEKASLWLLTVQYSHRWQHPPKQTLMFGETLIIYTRIQTNHQIPVRNNKLGTLQGVCLFIDEVVQYHKQQTESFVLLTSRIFDLPFVLQIKAIMALAAAILLLMIISKYLLDHCFLGYCVL